MATRKAPSAQAVSSKLKAYQDDPTLFCREVLGFEPWDRQADFMRLVAANKFTACRSGHKVGKTTSCAALALWFVTCFPRSRVVLTAPAAPQIERGLWMEVKRLYRQAATRGTPLGGTCNETAWSGLCFPDGRDIFGRSTKSKENFAGISSPNLMILVDEASGVSEEIFEAVFGNAAGNAWVVLISNPTQTSGRFYDVFHSSSDQWATIHIPSTDTPNFKGGKVPGLAAPEWASFMALEYGNPSPYYDVRVLGKFPEQSENAVIGLADVEAAVARGKLLTALEKGLLSPAHRAEVAPQLAALEALAHPDSPLVVGCDVARFGDDSTCFVPVRGLRMYMPKVLQSLDVVDVSGHAHAFAREQARPGELPLIRVDENGLGAGVCDHLKRRDHIRVVGVNVSERSDDPEKYVRKRDELWFLMRDWLRAGGILPDHKRLKAELLTPTYSFDVKGRYQVESKRDIKERVSGNKSPDVADAACLAVAKQIKTPRAQQLRELSEYRKHRVM